MNIIQTNIHQKNFQVETTIQYHYPPRDNTDTNRLPLKGGDVKFYPNNLAKEYVRWFSDVFNDCLVCSYLNHLLKNLSYKDNLEINRKYIQDLWSRMPLIR